MKSKWRIFVDVMTAISVISLIIFYVVPNLETIQKNSIYIFDLFVVILLVIDFYNQFKKSGLSLSKYVIKNWYEIPSMIPLIFFSALETHFIIEAIGGIILIGLFRIIHLFFRTARIFENNKVLYVLVFAFMAVFLGAVAEYFAESSNPDSKINTFGNALWWSIVTVTTVGYGDLYPITSAGRLIASILMLIGIAILGLFISTLGSSVIESKLSKLKNQNIRNTKDDVDIDNINNENEHIAKRTRKDETKLIVKDKVYSLENLTEDEIDMLVKIIKTIYYNKSKGEQY